jgi:predicted DNA-binding transcriptional regulator AlpA
MKPKLPASNVLADEALLSMNDLCGVFAMGLSTGWARVKNDPDFPKPIRLSSKCTRFRVSEVRAYIAKKEAAQ